MLPLGQLVAQRLEPVQQAVGVGAGRLRPAGGAAGRGRWPGGGAALGHGDGAAAEQHLAGRRPQPQHRVLVAGGHHIALLFQCVQVLAHPGGRGVLHDAVGGQPVQPAVQGVFVPAAPQHLHQRHHPQPAGPALLDAGQAGEDLLGFGGDVGLHKIAAAVAAVAALAGVVFAEIFQQHPPQAAGGLAVGHHPVQPLQLPGPDRPGLGGGQVLVVGIVVDEIAGGLHIPQREQQDALGLFAVAAGAAGFLVVVFQVFGHIIMQHETHIGFVDAHAEGVGGHHDPAAVVDEILLVLLPFAGFQPGVVAGGRDARRPQLAAERLDAFAGGAVDDAAFARVVEDVLLHIAFLVPGAGHREIEVGPVEAGGQGKRVAQPQQRRDVRLDLFGGGGGEGPHHRAAGQPGEKIRDLQVAGAEILPPLGDAVGFVHRHQPHIQPQGQVEEAVGLQPLGRHIQNAEGAVQRRRDDLPVSLLGLAGVDAGGGDAGFPQSGDLVLHQRDQRRDDQRDPPAQHRRDLVAG